MKRILVVEDNVSLAHSLGEIFDTMGYAVRLAYNGIEGWNQTQAELPDIIVSDIQMPGMDGYEFLKQVRGSYDTETLPFIFLTAQTEREQLRQGMILGADDFVTKPFSAKEIVASVESVLNKRTKINEKHETTITILRKNISYALPHELRTPLQLILGYSELMAMDSDSLTPGDIATMSTMVFKAGSRLQRLVENTLAYAQIELINSDPDQQKQLRNNILPDTADVIDLSATTIAEQHGRINDLKMQLTNKVLRISNENLTRTIEELVDNAFKFSDDSTTVTVKSMDCGDRYRIMIQDNGRGMKADQIKRIGAYMQFDRLLYEQQGSGLGLIIAKRLVELHQGTFHIRSMPNEGTLITIEFKI